LRDVIYDMNDENRINWNEVKAYLKAANVTEATNMGIYTNPMPQHQGGQVTTQRQPPVQTNPGPSASANTIRACTAARREMPLRPPQVL
jgi:hypothetical protein